MYYKLMKILITRVINNNLYNYNLPNINYKNLLHILTYEKNFNNSDKIYILNRLVNPINKKKIIDLLNNHNKKYIDIPFNIDDITEIKSYKKYKEYFYNKNYISNICIQYGKDNNYNWTLLLDQNNFITSKMYYEIINNIDLNNEIIYINSYEIENINKIIKSKNKIIHFNNKKIKSVKIGINKNNNIIFNSNKNNINNYLNTNNNNIILSNIISLPYKYKNKCFKKAFIKYIDNINNIFMIYNKYI